VGGWVGGWAEREGYKRGGIRIGFSQVLSAPGSRRSIDDLAPLEILEKHSSSQAALQLAVLRDLRTPLSSFSREA